MQFWLHMVVREYWREYIEQAWRQRPIVWLAGIRRAGKTVLARSLPQVRYFDCELPRTRRLMEDPEGFLDDLGPGDVILDEIHRLPNPSELLKITADHYPGIRILATGSSTLGASARFSDTLAGRKRDVWLTPMNLADMRNAKQTDIPHRLLRGGLPPFLLAASFPAADFQEWIDAFWARDIQELFRLERRSSFQKLMELLFVQSGAMFEANRFSAPCEVSRTTIATYLKALEATFVMHVIRPFNTHRSTEIVSAPKVYGFDTGFVAFYRGWQDLRAEDLGVLWEHFVLNEIMSLMQSREIFYWRDKAGHEVDFVLATRRHSPVAIECKWSASSFDPAGLKAFRRAYPQGENVVIAHDVTSAYSRVFGEISVRFQPLSAAAQVIAGTVGRSHRSTGITIA